MGRFSKDDYKNELEFLVDVDDNTFHYYQLKLLLNSVWLLYVKFGPGENMILLLYDVVFPFNTLRLELDE